MKTNRFTAYDSIYHDLREKILNGVYKPNAKLPSVLELCTMYNTSDSTIRKSLDMLKKNGYVFSEKRVGVYVSEKANKFHHINFHELENLKNMPNRCEIISLSEGGKDSIPADLSGDNVRLLRVERMYYYDTVLPILYKIDYIPHKAKFRFSSSNTKKWLDEMGFVLDSYFIEKSITFSLENEREDIKDMMIIPEQIGMFRIQKEYFSEAGNFAAYSEIYVSSTDINIKFILE